MCLPHDQEHCLRESSLFDRGLKTSLYVPRLMPSTTYLRGYGPFAQAVGQSLLWFLPTVCGKIFSPPRRPRRPLDQATFDCPISLSPSSCYPMLRNPLWHMHQLSRLDYESISLFLVRGETQTRSWHAFLHSPLKRFRHPFVRPSIVLYDSQINIP